MESDDGENFDYADDIDEKVHQKLVEDVLTLHKNLPAKKPLRVHYTPKAADIRVPRSVFIEEEELAIDDNILQSLKKPKKVKKSLQTSSAKTLPKPLEKPQAERIRRAVAYEKARLNLDKWEPVVTSNRAASHLTFPLNNDPKIEFKESRELTKSWRLKSKLQEELEKIDPPKVEVYEIDTEKEKNKVPKNMKDMLDHRNAMAKMRARQSYKEAKARRQNKIKSKSYHRIQRKKKIKQQLKEFEELQKTNPEEALKKLEEIDRVRAEERFSLRHRSTGQWAKNKQIRAKYDKESREMLAQQLAIGRELKEKVKHVDDDSEDDAPEDISDKNQFLNSSKVDPTNVWIGNIKPEKDVSEYITNYRQYWIEQNKELSQKSQENGEGTAGEASTETETVAENATTHVSSAVHQHEEEHVHCDIPSQTLVADKNPANNGKKENDTKRIVKDMEGQGSSTKKNDKKRMAEDMENLGSSKKKIDKKIVAEKENQGSSKKKKQHTTNEWNISSLDVEDIFQVLEDKLAKKMKKKAKSISKQLKRKDKEKVAKDAQQKVKKKFDLSLPVAVKKPILDEALAETTDNVDPESSETPLNLPENDDMNTIRKILTDETVENAKKQKQNKASKNADLQKIANAKATELNSLIPELLTRDEDESDEENNTKLEQLMDTFEDDGIINEFTKEKKEEIDKDRPKDIDMSLPGWGSWGGPGIQISKRKRRRFIIRMPKALPRRDDNKGMLIINEKANKKVNNLKVSDVPFPFTSVKDYEASLRAPIGRTFVPEKAFSKLIQPAVETKMGAIIEPMSKSILLDK